MIKTLKAYYNEIIIIEHHSYYVYIRIISKDKIYTSTNTLHFFVKFIFNYIKMICY